MFDYELLKNEKVILINNDVLLKHSDDIRGVSVIITNQRFLIFSMPSDVESFRFGKMIDSFKSSKLELIFEAKLTDFEKIVVGDAFDKYILKDTNYFYLNNKEVREYLEKFL